MSALKRSDRNPTLVLLSSTSTWPERSLVRTMYRAGRLPVHRSTLGTIPVARSVVSPPAAALARAALSVATVAPCGSSSSNVAEMEAEAAAFASLATTAEMLRIPAARMPVLSMLPGTTCGMAKVPHVVRWVGERFISQTCR